MCTYHYGCSKDTKGIRLQTNHKPSYKIEHLKHLEENYILSVNCLVGEPSIPSKTRYRYSLLRALGNAELRVLVRTFFPLGRMFFVRQEFRVRMFF